MKKRFIPIVLTVLLVSCKKDLLNTTDKKSLTTKHSLSNTLNASPIYTPTFDWESQTTIPITNGTSPILPWFSGSSTLAPLFIINDYKKIDGWELLYNLGQYPGETGQNYLVFYNKFTGIIRCYYYLANNVTGGSNGMWGLELSGTNSLLNSIGHFTKPINVPQLNPIAISSNITIGGTTKAITPGWNAFDTEITYDPAAINSNTLMRLISFDQNIQNMSLTGSISLSSEGTIATTSTKNPYQSAANSAAKAAGNEAKTWVKNNVGDKDSPKLIKLGISALASVASGGVTEIVNAGINLLFGSFIGKKNTTSTSTQKIEFKTNGTLTLTGTISSSSGNNVSSVANLWFPGTQVNSGNTLIPYYQKKLGVWNLEETPILKISRKASATGYDETTGVQWYGRGIQNPKNIKVIINPDLVSEIDHYEVSTSLVYYGQFQGNHDWNGSSPAHTLTSELLYIDGENQFYKVYGEKFGGPDIEPIPPGEITPIPYILIDSIDPRYVVKVTVTLFPKVGYVQDPIVITRSYVPTYELID